jgi:predicted HTH domain antitoxin
VEITVHLPDDLTQRPDPGRAALETLVVEGFRTGALSPVEASRLLGLSRIEFDGFLKERQIFDHAYDANELESDWSTVQHEIEERATQYTTWLRECPQASGLSIDRTNDHGPFPYQWKISWQNPPVFVGYVALDGSMVGAPEAEKRAYLCEQLGKKLNEAREAGKLS